ncbi:CPBP family intramembrane metalloprotease [Kiritimatiellaeota bacterium B1221]|nr:CPBP family intramembrane metalloprotease [Kiritimatiellaeota bacterium B1221]
MSILLNTASSHNRPASAASIGWFLGYFFTVMIGGALLGGFLIRLGLHGDGGLWQDFILEHGPARILRRFQTLCAVILAPWMLKKIGWGGITDLGWNSMQTRQERKRDFVQWFVLGCLGMIFVFSLALLSGVRNFNPFSFTVLISSLFSGFLITGIAVGFIEETLTRGVLYRSLAGVWTPWTAAIVSSLLFAWAHFMKATPESFEQGLGAIVWSSLFADFAKTAVPIKFFNMFAFGILLSRLVHHRGDIWAAVGLHAAAVGCIKMFSKMTEFDPAYGYRTWIGGHSSKFDDGWMLALVLVGLFCLTEWQYRNSLAPRSRVHL